MENILLIGSGGREHAIAKALTKDRNLNLHAAMALKNPGILRLAKSFVSTESDADTIVNFAREKKIDYCVIGPEKPLGEGITDRLTQAGVPCASPSQTAARIETDKAFMRSLLDRYKISGRISHIVTSSLQEAKAFCEKLDWRAAIKPVGLTSGKGVKVWGIIFKTPVKSVFILKKYLRKG